MRSGGDAQRWLGTIFTTDLRLEAPLSEVDLRRDGQSQRNRAVVFERVVVPSTRLGDAICAGTHRGAYFWRADNDGVLFFPAGRFDDRFVPALRGCATEHENTSTPVVSALAPEHDGWMQEFVAGDISPGAVTGACVFLTPDAERVLRDEHGITCELTRHRVQLAATLRAAAGGLDSLRLELDTAAIIGVRYTINCDAAKSTASPPCGYSSAKP